MIKNDDTIMTGINTDFIIVILLSQRSTIEGLLVKDYFG